MLTTAKALQLPPATCLTPIYALLAVLHSATWQWQHQGWSRCPWPSVGSASCHRLQTATSAPALPCPWEILLQASPVPLCKAPVSPATLHFIGFAAPSWLLPLYSCWWSWANHFSLSPRKKAWFFLVCEWDIENKMNITAYEQNFKSSLPHITHLTEAYFDHNTLFHISVWIKS